MAFNRFEQSLVDQYTNAQFPDLPPEPEQPMQADGVQLAMGGNAARRSDAPLSDVPIALWDTLAGALRGTVAQALGLPGDVESFVRMLSGGKQVLPTTERMGEILPPVVPPSAPGAEMRQKTAEVAGKFGEFNPVIGAPEAVKLGVKGVKAVAPMIPKNVPVGASTEVVGGTQAMLQSGKATAPVSDIGFYSAVEDAALNIQRKSGSGQAMLNDITKAANVKADEIKWIGLDDFLKGKKNVTKEEVQQFIAQNKVDVQEVQLADVKPAAVSTENITSYFDEALTPNGDEARNIFQFSFTEQGAREPTNFTAYELRGGTIELYDNRGNFIDEYGTIEGARNHVWNESQFAATQAEGRTKFGKYTLPGGENYREILLTLPNKDNVTREASVSPDGWGNTDGGTAGYVERGNTRADYRSGHWDQPNVLAHIRVNDRVDADGKKMLLVEEVQSDWHQAGRDKGYIGSYKKDDVKPYTTEQAKAEFGLDNADLFWYFKVPDNTFQIPKSRFATQDEALNYVLTEKKINQYGVPDAPMKDTWYQLALKRVLKYAADNGYERVGLTTGSRQAERYDLSKQVDSIGVSFNSRNMIDDNRSIRAVSVKLSPDQTLKFRVDDNGVVEWSNTVRDYKGTPLSDIIGKEMAGKVMAAEKTQTFSGIDLKIGGEGMKKYYDEVYPQFLAKYGKKWGAKMGETKINLQGDLEGFMPKKDMQVEPVRYIDITPQMRESVGKGQPLFTATGLGTGTAATMQDKEQK